MYQQQFYVSKGGQQDGPISLDEIVKRVQGKALDVNDYLYDEAQNDWVMLMAYPRLAEHLKTMKPAATPPSNVRKLVEEPKAGNEWFVLKGDNRFGPFSHAEVVRMLQDKTVYEFDYVWHAKLPAWERIASLAEFGPDTIRKLRDAGESGVNEIFFRRRHARTNYGASLLVHDNRHVYKGRSIEISVGGAGIVIENALLQPGDKLYLHFKPGDGVPPFNATCEVVSKRFVNASDKAAPVQYGVKFTQIAQQTQELLNDLAMKKRAA